MKIFKYEYEIGTLESDKTKEYGSLIANEQFIWNYIRPRLEKTRVCRYDKEVRLEWI